MFRVILPLAIVALVLTACTARNAAFSELPDGTHVYAGEFANSSEANVLFPKVDVEFRDAEGRVTDRQTVPTCLRSLIAQQGRTPFEATSDAEDSTQATASLVVESATTDQLPGGVGFIRIGVANADLTGNALSVRGTLTLQQGDPDTALEDLRVCVAVINAPADADDLVDHAGPTVRVVPVSLGDVHVPGEVDFRTTIELPSDPSEDGYYLDLYADALVGGMPIAPRSRPDVPVE